MCASLRDEGYGSYFLYSGIVFRTDAIKVTYNLDPRVCDGDELFKHVFGKDICV